MVSAADDMAQGIPVERSEYPEGEAGIQKSLRKMCVKIREGATTAIMRSYAGNLLQQAGSPSSIKERSNAFHGHVQEKVTFVHDPLGSELIQAAPITLCVPGAIACIPIEDCDGHVVALATLLAAIGVEVEIVRQFFGSDQQQHVICEARLEDGSWYPLDPASRQLPAGRKAPAVRESRMSPWDSSATGLSDQAEYVGIGAPPVLLLDDGGWRVAKDTDIVRARQGKWITLGHPGVEEFVEDACCSCCAAGKPCASKSDMAGVGAMWPGMQALSAHTNWLGQSWRLIDPEGRTWDQAIAAAHARAQRMDWPAGVNTAKFDLMALVVESAILTRAVSDMPDVGQRLANTLSRTWVIFAKRLGYNGESAAELKAKTNDRAAIAAVELILVLGLIVAATVIYVFIVIYAAKLIDNELQRRAADRELIRLQSQAQEITKRHLDSGLPLTDDEKEILQRLENAQAGIRPGQPSEIEAPIKPTSIWPWLALAGVIGVTVVAVAYAPEIKTFIAARQRKQVAAGEGSRRRKKRKRLAA